MTSADRIDVQQTLDTADSPSVNEIQQWVLRVLETVQQPLGDLTVRVVDEAEIQRLNHDYRQKNRPTNVLSFPAGPITGLPDDAEQPLGDIVICAPIVLREATEQGKQPADHWAHMLVHGTLHLVGFDHVDEAEALEMEALERQILASFGISDPYVAQP